MHRFTFSYLSFVAGVILTCLTTAHAESYTFKPIDVTDALGTEAMGINNRGDIVGSYETAGGMKHGFVFSQNVFTPIDFPGGLDTDTQVYSINNRGDMVGDYGSPYTDRGFLLSGGTFIPIDVPNSIRTHLAGVNDASEIVGFYFSVNLSQHAFRLSGDILTTLNIPGNSYATAINNHGDIVGSYSVGGPIHGFLVAGETVITIHVPGSINTTLYGINDSGDVVGVYDDAQGDHPFILSGGVFTIIDFPGSVWTQPKGVNDRGDIVGSYEVHDVYGFTVHGFIATKEQSGVVTALLDVKPGSSENTLNPRSKGVISVAILSTASFDASTVDQGSVTFGPSATLLEGSGRIEDVNGDGQPDIVLHFRTQHSGIQCGDTSVSIVGETIDGILIQGSDTIRTVGCTPKAGKKK